MSVSFPLRRASGAEMLFEEGGSALVGGLGRRLVVMLAAGPREGVVDAGIGMDRHLGVLAERRLDLRLRLGRAELVLLGDVEHERSTDLARLIERLLDADAIVTDIAIGVAARRHEIGELAAEAIADGADLAGAGGKAAQMRQARLEIGDALGFVETLIELEGARPFRLGLVRDLDAGLLPPEEIGTERGITLRGEVVG